MPEWKYRRLHSDEPGEILPEPDSVPEFDLSRIGSAGVRSRIIAGSYRKLLWPALRLLQLFRPVARFGGLTVVTREEDVRAILARSDLFPTPFGPEMQALAGGDTFLLGLEGDAHARQERILHALIDHERDIPRISALSSKFAEALLDAGKGRIDAQSDLITRVAAEVCCRYFGFAAKDTDQFAEWTIAASNFLFADPTGKPVAAELASVAGSRLRALADQALIAAAEMKTAPDTLAGRLVRMGREPEGPTRGEARAILIGLSVGFVPTNALAGGKMLHLLKKNAKARKAALAAAREGDTAALEAVLLEAGRLDPALAPGQWRWCPRDASYQRKDKSTVRIRGGSVVLVSTMAALRDPKAWKQPGAFRTDRDAAPDLLFGHPVHECLGRRLALAQIVPTMAALLRRNGIEASLPRLRLEWLGPYPSRAILDYSDPACDRSSGGTNQNGVLFALPLPEGTDVDTLNDRIEAAFSTSAVRSALDGTGLVHFLSLTAVEVHEKDGVRNLALLELDVDGPASDAAAKAVVAIEEPLRAVLTSVGVDTREPLVPFVLRHRIAMHGKPWGATALNFYGIPDLSVRDIEREAALARYVRTAMDAYQRRELGRSSRPAALLGHLRRLIGQDPELAQDPAWRDLAERGREFEDLILKPRGQGPALASWDTASRPSLWTIVIRSALFWRIAGAFVVLSFVAGVLLYILLDPGNGARAAMWLSLPWLALQSLLATFALFALLAAGALAVLRWKERQDSVDTARPSLAHLRKLARRENLPGHVKNHITVVTPLKRGLFRRFTLAFSLWGIGQLVTYYYRPGFVLDMGTIQFARWVRLPGTDTMIFQSNYDGSWESYLEDFITRAHAGQTAAWSNCEGFPASRFLIFDGAQNGDRFKHYVRRKQVPTAFWYARFPDISAAQIRRNTLIRDGLARAGSDTQAREWLALFGSAPRTEDEIESEEVQGIIFNGFGKLPQASYLVMRLPEDPRIAGEWLRVLNGFPFQNIRSHLAPMKAGAPEADGLLEAQSRITFGENDPPAGAVSVGLSANGIRRLVGADHPVIGQLPGPFVMGMRERAARLSDDPAAPLRWHDGEEREAVDVVLCIYSPDRDAHRIALSRQIALAEAHGLEVVEVQEALPLEPGGFPSDHFGFRDGMVQPVIAGSLKNARDRNPDDVIAAGEMICGYRNAQGYYPPPAAVPAAEDPLDILPDTAAPARRYPRFGPAETPEVVRDFARNGSFLAVRVLEQHVNEFEHACETIAEQTGARYTHLENELGAPIGAEWVAAKMIGRWPNGGSLLRHATRPDAVTAEDFTLAFGSDDPRGVQCPLGSHVRRANPRDSLQPGDAKEIAIVNRHRLMRRGRSYERGDEKGLFFMAICGDLERQFEFVQRSWLMAPHFHTLDNETDPLLGARDNADGVFTIPTSGGSIKLEGLGSYVSLKAGGYFFLPSRSALLYLADHALRRAGEIPMPENGAAD